MYILSTTFLSPQEYVDEEEDEEEDDKDKVKKPFFISYLANNIIVYVIIGISVVP